MYKILIWSDIQGDFIDWRGFKTFESWAEANNKATELQVETGQQCKVVYVRNVKRTKTMKTRGSRIQRFYAVEHPDGSFSKGVRCIPQPKKVSK